MGGSFGRRGHGAPGGHALPFFRMAAGRVSHGRVADPSLTELTLDGWGATILRLDEAGHVTRLPPETTHLEIHKIIQP